MCVLLGIRDNSAKSVPLDTKETLPNLGLLEVVYHVTVQVEELATQTLEIVIQEMKTQTLTVLTAPLVSIMIPRTHATASHALVKMASAAP